MNATLRITRERAAEVAVRGVSEALELFATPQPLERSLAQLLASLRRLLELRNAAVVLQDDGRDVDRIVTVGDDAEPTPRLSALLVAVSARLVTTGMPWVVENEILEPGLDEEPVQHGMELERSFVAVPIKNERGVRGALCIERLHSPGDQVGFCFDDDVRVLSVIANLVAQADRLERSRATGRPFVEQLAQNDEPCESEPLGAHPLWRAAVQRAKVAARTSSPIFLRGESGTGKEVLARLIHECSPRRERAFVSVNCAALSETVLQSELFGHERGAFTGAVAQRKGRFELADGGTLFLDEIGEISAPFQALLLRVLQLGEFERVGGTSTLHVDVRIVAASNRNLEQDVAQGKFRADLYYRIHVVPIALPPLRKRAEDIPLLAREFLKRFNERNGTELSLGASGRAALTRYEFPGNVRELENVVRRAATLATSTTLTGDDFAWLRQHSPLVAGLDESPQSARWPRAGGSYAGSDADAESMPSGANEPDFRQRLIAALERSGWVQAKAARLMGVTARQVAYACRKLNIPMRKL